MIRQLWRAFDRFPAYTNQTRIALAGQEHLVGDLTEADCLAHGITTNRDFIHGHCPCGPEPVQGDDEPDDAFIVRHNTWWDQRSDHEADDLLWYYRGEQWQRDDYITLPTESVDDAESAGRWVLPRTLLQSMPVEWQERFVELHRTIVGADAKDYAIRVYDLQDRETKEAVPHYNRGRTFVQPDLEVLT